MSVSKERRIIFFFCLISHKLLIGDKMKDDIVLNPFTMSLELENEIIPALNREYECSDSLVL